MTVKLIRLFVLPCCFASIMLFCATEAGTVAKQDPSTSPKKTVRKKSASSNGAAIARRQPAPTPQRYKEIQEALAAKGYLPADEVNGKWTDSSVSALKKFQTDQNLDATGKINSLSLIALGLGPKHETEGSAPPTPAPKANQ